MPVDTRWGRPAGGRVTWRRRRTRRPRRARSSTVDQHHPAPPAPAGGVKLFRQVPTARRATAPLGGTKSRRSRNQMIVVHSADWGIREFEGQTMSAHVYGVTEIVGTSPDGVDV